MGPGGNIVTGQPALRFKVSKMFKDIESTDS